MAKYIVALLGLVVVSGCLWLAVTFSLNWQSIMHADEQRTNALRMLSVGMTRAEAETILSAATTIYECSFGTYYMFDENPSKGAPIEIRFENVNGQQTIDKIYSPEIDVVVADIVACNRLK